jgi:hypothetical protein
MDDELEQLEAELKQLRPRTASPALAKRLERALKPERVVWPWAALPLAAALALTLILVERVPDPVAPCAPTLAQAEPGAELYKPVAAENVLYAAQDEGVVTLDNGTQARRVRHSYVDTITWRNPQTNASLRWSVPRDEVRVVPVNFQ